VLLLLLLLLLPPPPLLVDAHCCKRDCSAKLKLIAASVLASDCGERRGASTCICD
jgi:hypothetical protein